MFRRGLIMCLIAALLCCGHAFAAGEELEILFFNAGKADACLLRTPCSTVLIDAGTNKFGKELAEYFAQNGITHIDAMFITHFDKDHVGGADKVLESVRVDKVFEPDYSSSSKQYLQYREALQASGVQVETLAQNTLFELDGVQYVIDVANQTNYGEDEENDFSLVISVRYGQTSFLFAGDAENPRLSELLAEGVGKHDLLKVPHHGRVEKLSPAFFQAVQPRYAVITSDEEELEDDFVVDALQRYGTVYLTRNGSVKCVTDGRDIMIDQNGI